MSDGDTIGHAKVRPAAILLLAAAIWGFAFAAQRAGMAHVGPFAFGGIRFALGCLPLLPVVILQIRRRSPQGSHVRQVWPGLGLGVVLFVAVSLQQMGLVYTSAGKAGFITGLYVVLVPVFGLALRLRAGAGTWLGSVSAVAGLYLLSVREDLTMGAGDLLVLACAAVWAIHVLLLARAVQLMHWSTLAFLQFATCAVLSLVTAAFVEETSAANVVAAGVPILYAGLMSVGVGYTLQVIGQRTAPPAAAAVILSLEAAFAALAGWLVLNEQLSSRELGGCGLMLSAMVVSQLMPSGDRNSA